MLDWHAMQTGPCGGTRRDVQGIGGDKFLRRNRPFFEKWTATLIRLMMEVSPYLSASWLVSNNSEQYRRWFAHLAEQASSLPEFQGARIFGATLCVSPTWAKGTTCQATRLQGCWQICQTLLQAFQHLLNLPIQQRGAQCPCRMVRAQNIGHSMWSQV